PRPCVRRTTCRAKPRSASWSCRHACQRLEINPRCCRGACDTDQSRQADNACPSPEPTRRYRSSIRSQAIDERFFVASEIYQSGYKQYQRGAERDEEGIRVRDCAADQGPAKTLYHADHRIETVERLPA